MSDEIRPCHWLRTNRKSRRPGTVIFFDSEATITYPNDLVREHDFRLAVAAHCEYKRRTGLVELEQRVFHDTEALWAWVSAIAETRKSTLVVAHNIDYDARLSHAFHQLPDLGWSFGNCIMSYSCRFFPLSKQKRALQLLDNYNLFPVPLAELGQSIGLPKLGVDFDTVPDHELITYCERDVQILVDVWRRYLSFLDDHNMGDFSITLSGQSFNAYRHRFMPCKIGIHNHSEALLLERAAYRGGQTEAYFVGKLPRGKYYKLDVNGLYAAMMQWHKFPSKLVKVIQNVRANYLENLLKEYMVVAQVIVETETPSYPIKIGKRNEYPVGTFITTLTTPELKHALLRGEIRGIGLVALYTPVDLFSEYMKFLTPLRQQYKAAGDVARSKMCKRLRNALPGKFGQKGYDHKVIGKAPIDRVKVDRWLDEDPELCYTDWTFGGKIIRQWKKGEAPDSFAAVPAHVCAYGRLYMQALMRKAGSRNVYYMDTDSLFVNQTGLDRLKASLDDMALGKLKVEGVATDVRIRARKDYKFGSTERIKGVKKNATKIGADTYVQWHFTTLRYAFRSQSLEGVTLHRVTKELKRGQTADKIGRDGWVVPPRLTLAREEVWALTSHEEGADSWVWELDPNWEPSTAT